jgi:hypothetical protein
LTYDAISYVKSMASLTQTPEGEKTMLETKASYNIKEKGLLGNYRAAKQGTAYTL